MSAEHSTIAPTADPTLLGYRSPEWLQDHRAKLMPVYRGRKSQKQIVAYTVVGEADYEALSRHQWYLASAGSRNKVFYAKRSVGRKGDTCRVIAVHQVVSGVMGADHRNGDGLDNRRENLRTATISQNNRNVPSKPLAVSKFRGVHLDGRSQQLHAPFQGVAVHEGTYRSLGYYADRFEAAWISNHARSVLHGEFAVMNEIPPDKVPSPSRQTELIAQFESRHAKWAAKES